MDQPVNIDVIQVPYALCDEERGVGKGPGRVLRTELITKLGERGAGVASHRIQLNESPASDLDAVTRLGSSVFAVVRGAAAAARLPIVLGGNCCASLGAIAALSPAATGVIWFDAHGDFNTPETSPSGFIDGLALAIATGRCHEHAWREIGGDAVVDDGAIMLAGIRDLDEGEKRLIEESEVLAVYAGDFDGAQTGFASGIDALRKRAGRVYIHIDMDVVDPVESPGVEFRTRGGVTATQMMDAIAQIGERFEICGATVADFNPDFDREDQTAELASRLIQMIVESAKRR